MKITRRQLRSLITEAVDEEELRPVAELACTAAEIDVNTYRGRLLCELLLEKLKEQPDLVKEIMVLAKKGRDAVINFLKDLDIIGE